MIFIIYLLLGIVTGTFSGIFGIGGGLVILPILSLVFKSLGFPEDIIMHMAIGTSLSIIFFTVSSSTYHHYKSGGVDLNIVKKFIIFVILGTVAGGYFSTYISTNVLRIIFVIYVIIVALKMSLDFKKDTPLKNTPNSLYGLVGFIIGFKSALLGIGGGTISIPFLSWRGVEMKKAIGISAALGMPISFFGALTYIYNGYSLENLPEYSFGFIYLPAFIGVVLTSGVFSKVGAKISTKISQEKLKILFSTFLFIVAAKSIIEIIY